MSAGGCSWRVACRISTTVRPPNAGRPASISNRMARRGEEITAGVDARRPPVRAPYSVACPSRPGARQPLRRIERRLELGRARPKSSSLTPWGVRKTFDGLRSRWTMPRACSADSAASIPSPIGTAWDTLKGPRRRRSPSASPSSSSMAMNSCPVFADLVDLADVRMIDTGRRARFPPEPFARRLIAAHRQHRLERDDTLQPFVARCIDDAHPAFAELASNGVVPNPRWQALSRWAGRARRGIRRRRRSYEPVVQDAQPSFGCVVSRLVRHKNLSVTKSRSYLQPCGCYLKMFPSALLIAFVASSLSLFFMARVAAAPTSMRTAGD